MYVEKIVYETHNGRTIKVQPQKNKKVEKTEEKLEMKNSEGDANANK